MPYENNSLVGKKIRYLLKLIPVVVSYKIVLDLSPHNIIGLVKQFMIRFTKSNASAQKYNTKHGKKKDKLVTI